jgi:hypothetical protein
VVEGRVLSEREPTDVARSSAEQRDERVVPELGLEVPLWYGMVWCPSYPPISVFSH